DGRAVRRRGAGRRAARGVPAAVGWREELLGVPGRGSTAALARPRRGTARGARARARIWPVAARDGARGGLAAGGIAALRADGGGEWAGAIRATPRARSGWPPRATWSCPARDSRGPQLASPYPTARTQSPARRHSPLAATAARAWIFTGVLHAVGTRGQFPGEGRRMPRLSRQHGPLRGPFSHLEVSFSPT